MKKMLMCFVGITLLALACKKDEVLPDYANMIVGKWMYINQFGVASASTGVISRDTLTYNNGSYFDFRANNKFYVYVKETNKTTRDSGTYSVVGNQFYASLYSGKKDTGTIRTITSSNLTIYNKNTILPGVTQEVWNNFQK